MLHLAYLGEARKIDIPDNSLKLLIVRKPVTKIPKGFIHVPQLSPSEKLFKKTMGNWKNGIFSKKELYFLESKNISSKNPDAW